MTMFDRGEFLYASASWPSSTALTWLSCSAVKGLPTVVNSDSHMDKYWSIMLGAAGNVIVPLTTDRRCNRRVIASRRVGLTERGGGSSIAGNVKEGAAVAHDYRATCCGQFGLEAIRP
jgi:hypothetical protein